MKICICNNVSDKDLVGALCSGECASVKDLRKRFNVTGCCGRCRPSVEALVCKHCPLATAQCADSIGSTHE